MSKRPSPLVRTRTAAALKADARLLSGDPARVALAVADSDEDAPEAGTKVGELWLYGLVGGWWRGFDAESVSRALRAMGDVDVLYVRIHSPGGRADDGIAIANLLRNFDARVVTVVDGTAASAASVIAVAGDEVVICPGAQLMLHDAATGMYAWGDAAYLRTQVDELQRLVDWIDGQSQNYAGVYAYKAGGTADEWRQVMTANGLLGRWYSGEEAVAAKLADRVGTITAVGSPPVAPEDEFDDDDEDFLARVEHDLQLLEQHVPAAARAAWEGKPIPSAKKPAPQPPSASAVGSTHTEGGTAVTFSDAQLTTMRESLNLEETADEAAIMAAVQAVVAENLELAEDRPATAAAADGTVAIPEVRLKDLEAAAATGVAASKKLQEMEREAFLDANKSKFPATSRADWGKRFDKDPDGTRELLAAAADLVPTELLGHESDGVTREDGKASLSLEDIRNDDGYQNWKVI